ncbi:MAG: DUF3365 domain-containing protein [bacterium]|nr:DUF3365 domain-containing protein [bacterium]
MSRWFYITVAVSLLCMVGCGGYEAKEPSGGEATVGSAEPAQWAPIEVQAMNAAQMEQMDRCNIARDEYVDALMTELSVALGNGGPTEAIQVCSIRAPEIAADVSNRHALMIGRTSHKLRNPVNQAPEWAQSHIRGRVEDVAHFLGPDGMLGVLMPVRVQEPCLTCHGQADTMQSKLKANLDALYPNDQATGFREGDLRGWLWAEVSPSDSAS